MNIKEEKNRNTLLPADGVSLSQVVFLKIDAWDAPNADIPADYKHAKLFIIDGVMQACIGGENYTLQRGDMADIINCSLKLSGFSENARAYLLLLTDDYLNSLFELKMLSSPSYPIDILQNPIAHLPPAEYPYLVHMMENVEQAVSHNFKSASPDILRYKVLTFFLEWTNLREAHTGSANSTETETDKRRCLFTRFIELLTMHIRSEHTVSFYAEHLCVSPQYLRRIIKEQSKQSAHDLISHFLLHEICRLLLETDHTIQEIADELHFSDQAVLSKFFKRLKGVSPLKYRNLRRQT